MITVSLVSRQMLSLSNIKQAKEQTVMTSMDGGLEDQVSTTEQSSSAANISQDDTSPHPVNFDKSTINNSNDVVLPEAFVSAGWTKSPTVGRTSEVVLLDERSLLACIVRTIPPGGRIRISSTVSIFISCQVIARGIALCTFFYPKYLRISVFLVMCSYQIDLERCLHLYTGMITRKSMESWMTLWLATLR